MVQAEAAKGSVLCTARRAATGLAAGPCPASMGLAWQPASGATYSSHHGMARVTALLPLPQPTAAAYGPSPGNANAAAGLAMLTGVSPANLIKSTKMWVVPHIRASLDHPGILDPAY